jgi:phospholipase D3/4
MVADNRSFYVGSANMDWRSLTQVKELGATLKDCPPLARDLDKIFEVYWYLGQNDSKIPEEWPQYLSTDINLDNPLQLKLNGIPSEVYITSSPKPFNPNGRTNDVQALLSVINNASKFIYIAVMDYFPTFLYSYPTKFWPDIDDALRKAAIERNVEVRLLGSHWNHTRKAMYRFLKSLDVFYDYSKTGGKIEAKLFVVPTLEKPVQIPFSRVNHNKYMVTDKSAFIGTSNWSADYFLNTAGVSLVIHETNSTCYQEASLRSKLKSIFERDWSSKYSQFLYDIQENCDREFDDCTSNSIEQ